MKLETNHDPIERGIVEAFDMAVLDARDEARAIAGRSSRTGKFARSIIATETRRTETGLEARIGSPLSSARAKERGAYIAAKRAPTLVILTNDGWRRPAAVRLAPQPAVTPAGRRFAQFMTQRLRQVFG